jgi:hypothetical protein
MKKMSVLVWQATELGKHIVVKIPHDGQNPHKFVKSALSAYKKQL